MNTDIRSFFKPAKKTARRGNEPTQNESETGESKPKPKLKPKSPRQATLESLGRVVSLEEFERCKCILKEDSASKERIIEGKKILRNTRYKKIFSLIRILALESLGKKHPGRDVIKKTGLGLILNDYRKHNDENVKEAASKVYRKVVFLNLI